MNKGLMIITPVILVRLLTVEDFGRYREFLVYASLLTTIATFSFNGSLLRFVPAYPKSGWRFVNQAVLMTFVGSLVVAGGTLLLNTILAGRLVGEYAIPLAVYVIFFVNVDFWNYLWLAEKRSFAVLGYSTGRLVARIMVVVTAAALTRDVATIIWSIICYEGLRLAVSVISWQVQSRTRAAQTRAIESSSWREQLQYCLPFGMAAVLITLNKSMGSVFVAKLLGPVALAHYTMGLYVQPVLAIIRSSLSDVVLPEMVSRKEASPASNGLNLWRRSTVMTAILLLAAGVLLARFAEVLVVTLFSEQYRPVIGIFQIYLLVFLREAMDFGIPLRAINRNTPILYSNLIAIAVNALLMVILMPFWGITGAVIALVVSRFVDGAYLAWQMARAYEVPMRLVAPWKDLLKVLGAAVLAAVVLYGRFWTERLGPLGVVLGGGVYIVTFAVLLLRLRIPEAALLLEKLRSAPALVLRATSMRRDS
jgi:O-antigen/teichoic acid export membrane protein